jgi:chromosome segregation ATPase
MKTGIFDLEEPEHSAAAPAPRQRGALIALSAVVVSLGGYTVWGVQTNRSQLGAQRALVGQLNLQLTSLTSQNGSLRTQLDETRTQLDESARKLVAADELAGSARALAQKGRSEAQRSAKLLEEKLGEHEKEVGTLNGSVDGIKGDLAANRAELDKAFGELLKHGSLIARNHDELETLKKMGFRDYFEFELRQAKSFTRVGPLALRLNKTDRGHQRYTFTVVVDDKKVEKKDNALLEPVQFYVPGTRSMLEVVAAEIHDGRVVGYVSSPKEAAPIS